MQASRSTRYSPSPTSPLTGRRSPSPPQPMSKRDKRKQQHTHLQQELQNDFNSNREQHYREQLIALQTDMNLVSQADPYALEPLEDSPHGIAQIIEAAAQGTPYQSEMSTLAGKWYTEFLQEVNEAKESKEIHLADLERNHKKRLERLQYECDFKLHLAAEEYDHMTNTLRERLAQSLHTKRQRLMKEKEQLDIADTNALLLNPNQFSITNPTSPGAHTSRKTRLTRHRGDAEDGNGVTEISNKRKRKAVDDDHGSPTRNGHTTPAEMARTANITQQTDKIYSINQLFTDKELYYQSHQAQIAARHFFSTSHKEGEINGMSKRNKDDGDKSDSSEESDKDDGALEAPGMERTASQTVHVTRSTRNIGGGLSGLNILSDLAEKAATRPALPYATLYTHQSKNGTILPMPSQLMPEELEEDAVRMTQALSAPAGFVDTKAIEDALKPVTESRSTLAPDWPIYMQMHLVDMDPRRGPGVI